MTEIKVTSHFDKQKYQREIKRIGGGGIRGAAAYLRKVARSRIKWRKNNNTSSPAGSSPNTHGNLRFFKNSIVFSVEGNTAYVGPAALPGKHGAVKNLGAIHEFGGMFPPVVGTRKRAARNWDTAKTGPVDIRAGEMVFIKLRSKRQRERAWEIEKEYATKQGGNRRERELKKLMLLKAAERSGKLFCYPARPTMGPSLQRILPELPRFWQSRAIESGILSD